MWNRRICWLAVSAVLAGMTAIGCESRRNGPESASESSSEESNDSPDGESPEKSQKPDEQSSCSPPDPSGVGATDLVDGHTFEAPIYATQAPGDDAVYVVERPGRILVVEDGELRDEPFLDITDRVGTGHQERGLLGLAFHPNYQDNGRFFIYYTPADDHQNVIAEYSRAENGDRLADTEEIRRLVAIDDPEDNHNGGMLTFGPDGHLYAGMGDGGGAGDRHGKIGNGQNRESLLGSILRLDVDAPGRDFAAAGNPFVDAPGQPQIWAWGLRNPWRFSFDRKTGHMYIGDVGQNQIEEVSFQPSDSDGGANYGWRGYEGRSLFDESVAEDIEEHVPPIVTFEHGASEGPLREGCSITGGYVYRGEAHEGLQGAYIYGDYCSPDVAAFRYCDGEVVGHQRVPGLSDLGSGLGSFGEGNDGELYLLYHGSGHVKRLVREQ